jgi:dsDNA-binding SOS-regulon protein
MPITFTKTYLTSDGQSWLKLAEAQQREIAIILAAGGDSPGNPCPWEAAALDIIKNRDAVLTILKQKERQRTRATKPKRAARVAAKPTETVTA